jgi:tetratricopeptide (TPR) repeat protein
MSFALAEEQAGRELTSAVVSRFWFRKGLGCVRENPGGTLGLWVRKAYYLVNNHEVADNLDFYAVTEISPPLRMLPLRFGLLFAVALPGLLILWRSDRGRLLMLYGLAVVLPVLVFFYVGRFRLPLLPILSIAAAASILELSHRWRRKPRRIGLPVLLIILGLLLSYSRLFGVAEDTSWHFYRSRGDILYGQGQLAAACQAYEEAVRRHPSNAATRNALAFAYAEQGVNLDQAEQHIRIALELAPQRRRFYLDTLGWIQYKQGELGAAAKALEEAIPLFASHEAYSRAEARYHLGLVRQAQGDLVAAERLFRAALPDYPQAEDALAALPPAEEDRARE